MAAEKKGNADKPKYAARKAIPIPANRDDAEAFGSAYAEMLTSGPMAAMRIIRASERSAGYEADIDFPSLLATLRQQGEAVNAGNLAQSEAMLMNQATALQTVFARLVERGMNCTETIAFEMNLRMGLRAQSQCRATLETLAAIKNPSSVAFVRQANIANGPQQVNNALRPPERSRPRENEIAPNKLLETTNGERVDTRAPGTPVGADQELESLESFDGAKDAGGQSAYIPKCG